MDLVKSEVKKEFHRGAWESPGLRDDQIRNYFEELAKKKEIEIFSVSIDDRKTLKNDKDKRIVEVKKGATLHPKEKLESYLNYIIKTRQGVMYTLEIKGGYFCIGAEGPGSASCSCCLDRLNRKLDLRKVKETSGGLSLPSLSFPKDTIVAKFYFSYHEYDPYHSKQWTSSVYFYGKRSVRNKLFKNVYEFFKENLKI
ncbi:MAG: hypothetical protein ACKKMW_00355 [Candidatus Nealsonbacteria bacterium]